MREMQAEMDKGEWDKFVKHEQVKLRKNFNRLEKFYGGLADLEKMPDALFVIDIKKERNAIKEAREINIPVVAVVDTNSDPNNVAYPIVANDDSLSSIEYIANKIIEAYSQGKK
jgi:small subunit ribosomal protein S2